MATTSVKRIKDVWGVNANPATYTFCGVIATVRFSQRDICSDSDYTHCYLLT